MNALDSVSLFLNSLQSFVVSLSCGLGGQLIWPSHLVIKNILCKRVARISVYP